MTSTTRPTHAKAGSPDRLDPRSGLRAEDLKQAVTDHLSYSLGRLPSVAPPHHWYHALALGVRDRMHLHWIDTTQT